MRFRFLHAADLHLDTPFTRLTGVPERVAETLRDASLRAFEVLVDTAIAEGVAFVVFAGDIYDGAERGVRAQLAFRDGCARLGAAGISVFVVYGNHDPIHEGWSAIESFPDGVTVFGSDSVETVPVRIDDTIVATVSGISYATAEQTENLATRFPQAKGKGFHVALLHANVGGNGDYAPYSPCSMDDLRAGGYDYWALGHIHKRGELGDGHPLIVYPGNLQGRSPKPSEQGPKGAVIVEVDGKTASTRFVELDTVRFDHVEVVIDGLGLDGLEQVLVDAAADAQHAAGGRPLVVRGIIGGRGDLHDELAPAGRRTEMLDRLRDLSRNDDPFVWWDDLTWHTRPAIDVAERASGDDFIGDLLREVERNGADADWVPAIGVEYRNWLGDRMPRAGDPELFDEAVDTALVALLEDS
ncbi:MAG: DNA repair exonuclease [Actinobacteria bacterium]|nr:DNA repair exonuclease [Actinomycetota bacterium]